jgi:BirA family biotin operon repressor/biotin-[acetyl-CoA-carboxylase] ligase
MSIGGGIVRLASVSSTMDIVDEEARAGAPEGLVVVADEQTAGRGRSGRNWSAPPGSSLLCSVLLRPPVPPSRLGPLPLLIGVAVAEAIETVAATTCALKWPNDVLIDGRKVAGILIQSRLSESRVEYVNVGIGINLDVPDSALPDGAISLSSAAASAIDRDAVLMALIERLDVAHSSYVESEGRPSLDGWTRRAAMLGEQIAVRLEGGELSGRLIGVDEVGRLLLETTSGDVVALTQGDVVRGPRRTTAGAGN